MLLEETEKAGLGGEMMLDLAEKRGISVSGFGLKTPLKGFSAHWEAALVCHVCGVQSSVWGIAGETQGLAPLERHF